MSKKVIIIGAGPGGLAAAMLLATAGMDVTILERAQKVGGRTSRIEVDGFRFDDLKNTYLVGGGTHPGSGLPVIFESAKISTKLLLEDVM